ncbi:glutamine synthetase family protein [Acidocella sp.]|uniref:glutamine synthetase family protein n=1 Tax=Acidocella sp. TaxID=50710 RepID=UPI0026247B15|nr:glutamine synthetase family protein [Acidocella sp.]
MMRNLPAGQAEQVHRTGSGNDPGAALLISLIDCAGVTRGKTVPLARAPSAAASGLGASPSWALFCVDNAIAWIPSITPVGDHRLRADMNAALRLDERLTWAPAEVWEQEGGRAFWCARSLLRAQMVALAAEGIDVKSAGEIEFVLLPNGEAGETGWQAYGVGPLLDQEGFVTEVIESFERLGLGLEQFHSEYGDGQYELSLAPADPVAAMDKIALSRILLGRIARRHGCRVSLSPLPFAGGTGNGAHIHFSFTRNGEPLLAEGSGPHGITPEGGAMMGGIICHLPEMVGLLAPSILSPARLQPGRWAGAFACWGRENREAALRYCAANPGNPGGAHLEIKCVDPSANPYIAAATILAMARAGLEAGLALPPEVEADPAALSAEEREARQILPLGGDPQAILKRLEESPLARRWLDPQMLAALLAVRWHELERYGGQPLEDVTSALRFAWSV